MSIKKTTLFWIISAIVFFGLVYLLKGILLPFVLSFILAYVLNPLTVRLEKHGLSRTWATSIVVSLLILVFLISMLILIPVLESQIIAFVVKIPTLANALWIRLQPVFDTVKDHVSTAQMDYLKETLSSQSLRIVNETGTTLMRLFTNWSALFNLVSFLIIIPVVTFYILNDWKEIAAQIKGLIPRKKATFIHTKMDEVDEVLSAFVRGQAVVCVFLALFYGLGLSVVNLDFGFSIGFIAGLFSFIPYVGTLTGFILSLLLAFTQSADWSVFLGILMVFGIGQFLEGYFLTPKLVGERVKLHPAWIIFALFAAGYLFGFLGVLLAVPVFAILGVVIRTAIEKYKDSVLYKGTR